MKDDRSKMIDPAFFSCHLSAISYSGESRSAADHAGQASLTAIPVDRHRFPGFFTVVYAFMTAVEFKFTAVDKRFTAVEFKFTAVEIDFTCGKSLINRGKSFINRGKSLINRGKSLINRGKSLINRGKSLINRGNKRGVCGKKTKYRAPRVGYRWNMRRDTNAVPGNRLPKINFRTFCNQPAEPA
ncbi:MAG: hypothetical protein JSS81_03650 [Acidobacteria bacterium]|nr:hypothetical protein [Acidobacteriota bacterium]